MTASEMPSHTHTEAVYGSAGGFTNGTTGLRITGGSAVATSFGSAQPSGASGDGQPFNVIQPSVALLFCTKT